MKELKNGRLRHNKNIISGAKSVIQNCFFKLRFFQIKQRFMHICAYFKANLMKTSKVPRTKKKKRFTFP